MDGNVVVLLGEWIGPDMPLVGRWRQSPRAGEVIVLSEGGSLKYERNIVLNLKFIDSSGFMFEL